MKLDGDWYNELGSKMSLTTQGADVVGHYTTGVGNAKGSYELVGRVDDTGGDGSKNVGFVVSWSSPAASGTSVTAWSGQLQVLGGEETLTTTWVLSDETPPWDSWKSTLLGKDVFRRKPFLGRSVSIDGTWYNELGSMMVVTVDPKAPLTFRGKYHTAVGDADGMYELVGRTDGGQVPCQNVGFTVSWQNGKRNADSVTVWTGQLRFVDGEEVLSTAWLLTVETTAGDNWKATIAGQDVFTRKPFDASRVKAALASRQAPHPRAALVTAKPPAATPGQPKAAGA